MTFMELNEDGAELVKPISCFLFISFSVGFGILLFTMILYAILQLFVSGGFGELNSIIDDDDNDGERIDGNEDLEDV